MIKRLPLLLIFLCLQQIIYAQSDFRKATIFTNNGDTINGFANYWEGNKKFWECEFKSSMDGSIKTYTPEELWGFKFEDDAYFKTLERDNGNIPAFYEVLVEGPVTLYKLEEDFFAEKGDTLFVRLKNTVEEVKRQDKAFIKEHKEYVGLLSYMMTDCPEIHQRMSDLRFNEKSLARFIEVSPKAKKSWATFSLYPVVGINQSRVKFNKEILYYYHFTEDFDPVYSTVPGLIIQVNSPRIHERLSFITGLEYLNTSYESSITDNTDYYSDYHSVNINISQIKIPLGIGYTFFLNNFTPFIKAGFLNTFHLSTSNNWIRVRKYDDQSNSYENDAFIIYRMNNQQTGFWGSAGVQNKIFGLPMLIELRYERTSGIINKLMSASVVSNLQLRVGVKL